MPGMNLIFRSEGNIWSVVFVDNRGVEAQLQDHIFSVLLPIVPVPSIGNVLYVTHTIASQGLNNLLCIRLPKTDNSFLPKRPPAGFYSLIVVHERDFTYPADFGVIHLQPEVQSLLLRTFTVPFPSQQFSIREENPTYIQQPFPHIPAEGIREVDATLLIEREEIKQLRVEPIELEEDRKTVLTQHETITPSEVVNYLPEDAVELTSVVKSQLIKVNPKQNSFLTELNSTIIFWGNTHSAEEFFDDMVRLCSIYPDDTPDFKDKNLCLVLCLKLAAIPFYRDDLSTQKVYFAILAKLATLLNSKIAAEARGILDKISSWEQICRNVDFIYHDDQISRQIQDFCMHRISELRLLQNQAKPILSLCNTSAAVANARLTNTTADPTTGLDSAFVSQKVNPQKPKNKNKSKSKAKLQDDNDKFFEEFDAERMKEMRIPLKKKFAAMVKILEGENKDDILGLQTRIANDPRVLNELNDKEENLLLIAMRCIGNRFEVQKDSNRKKTGNLTAFINGYLELIKFIAVHKNCNMLLQSTMNKSVLDYLAENTKYIPVAYRALFWNTVLKQYMHMLEDAFAEDLDHANEPGLINYESIVANLHSRTIDGPTFLHILLEEPENISLVLELLQNTLKVERFTQQEILSRVETPLLIAKHKGRNLRARIEEIGVDLILNKVLEDDLRDCCVLLELLNYYFIKVGMELAAKSVPIDNFVELGDFFNLTGEDNLIVRLVNEITIDKNKNLNLQGLQALEFVLIGRSYHETALRENLPIDEKNVYLAFLSEDIANTMLSFLQENPPQLEKMINFMHKWLEIEKLSEPNNGFKGRLSNQLEFLTARLITFSEPADLRPLIQLIDILQHNDPESKNFWTRTLINACAACFKSISGREHDLVVNWLHLCCERVTNPKYDFSTELDLDKSNIDRNGLDVNGNNILHHFFSQVNPWMIMKLDNKHDATADQVVASTTSFVEAVNFLIEKAKTCPRLKEQLVGLLGAKNYYNLTPMQLLEAGISQHPHPKSSAVVNELKILHDKFTSIARPSSPKLRVAY